MVSRGKPSFIWRVGILSWALPVFLVTMAWDYYTHFHAHRPFDVTILTIAVRLAIWVAAGCFFGGTMWNRYHEMLDRQS